jgi:hypothetical protein
MSEQRGPQQRKADALTAPAENRDLWLAAASCSGFSHIDALRAVRLPAVD